MSNKTRQYTGETCRECGAAIYTDVMDFGPNVSPRYRKDGPTCWTNSCSLDLARRAAPGFVTYE